MTDYFPAAEKPWFKPPSAELTNGKPRTATVIGAGLAGSAIARHLAESGLSVRVLEEKSEIAAAASGNPLGMFKPQEKSKDTHLTTYHRTSYRYFLSYLETMVAGHPEFMVDRVGVQQLSDDRTQHHQGRFYASAGSLDPALFCKVQLKHAKISVSTRSNVAGLERESSHWLCVDKHGNTLSRSQIVILANSLNAMSLIEAKWLNLAPLAGQISFLAKDAILPPVKQIVSGQKYLIPQQDGGYICGATHHRTENLVVSDADHDSNIKGLQILLPQSMIDRNQVKGGRSSVRCITPDHLPAMGCVPDADFYFKHYGSLHHGRHYEVYPRAQYHKGLYVITGLGSHGIAASPYLAYLLNQSICSGNNKIDTATTELLHPARFLIRELRKKPSDRSTSTS